MTRLADLIRRVIDCFYVRPWSEWVSPTLFRYAACGGLNLALDAVWYAIIYHWIVAERFVNLGFVVISPHILSLAMVFPITLFNGFWLNRHVAFRTSPVGTGRQLVRYLLTVVGSIAVNYLCMKLLVEAAGVWPTPSKVLTSLITALYSYLAARYFAFREAAKE